MSPHPAWLHRFAVLTAAATFVLLGIGGLVTSKGAGMAVPDWPTSYGYNMFALPFHFWQGGALYEHTHRLAGAAVGLLTTVLAVWLWFAETRRWMRWLGVIALAAVVFQGVLGGLRVVWLKDEIGIVHAGLAQLFFVLICALALFTSRWWKDLPEPLVTGREAGHVTPCAPAEPQGPDCGAHGVTRPTRQPSPGESRAFGLGRLRGLVLAVTLLIFGQLMLGAAMRHQHAGLAIPDFPLAYGRLWPAMDADSVARYNQQRIEVQAARPITAFQIVLHMAHRLMAVAILVGVAVVAWLSRRRKEADRALLPLPPPIRVGGYGGSLQRLAFVWLGLILVQIGLGAWTVWSNKAADVATLHVLVGALSLVTGALWCVIGFHRSPRCSGPVSAAATERACGGLTFKSPATGTN